MEDYIYGFFINKILLVESPIYSFILYKSSDCEMTCNKSFDMFEKQSELD